MLNVVVLNGGRGAASIIPALLRRRGLNVTSIVNAYDDGKSTGAIRKFFDMLGPSDIRKVQELMLPVEAGGHEADLALFSHRYPLDAGHDEVLTDMRAFAEGGETIAGIRPDDRVATTVRRFVREFVDTLAVIEKARGQAFDFADCSLMNCLYAGAYLTCERDLELTTRTFDRLFRLAGTVLPNSVENKWLAAVRENGDVLASEAEIVELRSNIRVEAIYLLDRPLDREGLSALSPDEQRLFLKRHHAPASASPGVRLALEAAEIIIYSAGTQHSSLYPTYMSRGVAATIAANRDALKIFVTNIGADYETPSYRAADYLRGAYKFLCLGEHRRLAESELFSAALVNTSRRKADETYVDYDEDGYAGLETPRIVADFESERAPGKHDGDKVVDTVLRLYNQGHSAA